MASSNRLEANYMSGCGGPVMLKQSSLTLIRQPDIPIRYEVGSCYVIIGGITLYITLVS